MSTEGTAEARRYAGVHILGNPFCIDGTFHYYIPHTMQDAVEPGSFVTVPFGKANRKQIALVTELCGTDRLAEHHLDPDKIKPIGGLCRKDLSLSEKQLRLCFFLKEQTLCTIGEAVHTVIPKAALASLTEFFRVLPLPSPSAPASLSREDLMVYEYLRTRGVVSAQTVKGHFGTKAGASLDRICEKGLAERELTLKEPVTPTVTYYSLSESIEETEAVLRGENPQIRLKSATHRNILQCLIENGRMTDADLREKSGGGPVQFRALIRKGLVREETFTVSVSPFDDRPCGTRTPYTLSEEQENAVHTLEVLADSGEPKAALLYGVTGSGKTCVILEMIDRMLDRGKGVIVLLPEISLTPQMLAIFRARYGHLVAVIHSRLSAGERLDSHRRIMKGEASVVIGTRSAVFAPVHHLGMIVMDEEQENTYKSDQNPKYHARDIARFRCGTENALLLLSSATPSVESYEKAMEGLYTLITMKQRYGSSVLPQVEIVDMRSEAQNGNTTPVGQRLHGELLRVLEEGNQSILFLNRRGYSPKLVCRSCGKAVSCPHCSVAMNYHTKPGRFDEGDMVCHWCGTHRPRPEVCPECGSPHLVLMGYGTQRVEEELGVLVPNARILRMDADTTAAKSAYQDILTRFRDREGDILLGTQMVTKGHDFPDVTLVGVLMADTSLYVDDYRANERTFSLLTQVIGRAGRADKEGKAIIQTMNPDNDIIRLACEQDYEAFFRQEIRLRKLLQFPPFCDIVLMNLTSPDEKELQKGCLRLSETLSDLCNHTFSDVPLISFGPFEDPVYRVDNVFRMRTVVKCRLNRRSRTLFAELLTRFSSSSRGRLSPVLNMDFNPSYI